MGLLFLTGFFIQHKGNIAAGNHHFRLYGQTS